MKDPEALDFLQNEADLEIDGIGSHATRPTAHRFTERSGTGMKGPLPLSTSLPDCLLLRAFVVSRDQHAFAAIVERYRAFVIATAIRRGVDRGSAEDVAQEIFSILSAKSGALLRRASIAGWLHRATIFEASKVLEAEARRHSRQAAWTSLEAIGRRHHTPAVEQMLRLLDEALDEMSASDREILILHYLQDLPYPAVAAKLDVSEIAVRQRVSRALGRLESRLAHKGVRGSAAAALLAAAAMQNVTATATAVSTVLAMVSSAAGTIWSSVVSGFGAVSAKGTGMAACAAAAAVVVGFQVIGSPPPITSIPREQRVLAPEKAGPPVSPSAGVMGLPPSRAPQQPVSASLGFNRTNPRGSARTIETEPKSIRRNGSMQSPLIADGRSGTSDAPSRSESSTSRTIDQPPSLQERASTNGLPAVFEELQAIELVPAEAAAIYQGLLTELLHLSPAETGTVRNILNDYFDALNEAGVAGTPVSKTVLATWQAVREPLMQTAVASIGDALAELSPDLANTKVVDTVEEVLTFPDKLVTEVVQPVEGTVTGVADAVRDPLSDTVKEFLPLKLPRLR